jgi:CubicO group peptidase (beta-lactamase class C family)
MTSWRAILTAFTLITAAGPTAPAATAGATSAPSLVERTEALLSEWNRLDRPGGSVAVVHGGEVVFLRSYGLASLEHEVPNTDRTRYDVVTLGEPLTATAVARLVADGRLALDDDVRTWLPELPPFDPPVRVRHLLHHTSGLWDWPAVWQLAGGYLEDVITVEQILALIARQPAPEFEPGSRSEHSVTDATLLAEIVARATGQAYRDWLWEHVLRPGGMIHTVVRDRGGEPIPHSAEGYEYGTLSGYRRSPLNLAAPGGHGLYATIEDMAAWLAGLATADLLAEEPLTDGTPAGWVHGLRRDVLQGANCYRLSGRWQGFNTALLYLPEERLGVVVLSNWVSRWVDPVSQAGAIASLWLGPPDEPSPASPADPEDMEHPPDPTRYPELTGTYRWEPGDLFEVVVDGERLAFQQGRLRLPMTELAPDRFVLDAYPYRFTFVRADDGAVDHCRIQHRGDPVVVAARIELAEPGPDELADLVGEYSAPALGASYRLELREDGLVLSHERRGDVPLTPEAADHFTASGAPFRMLRLVRDEDGGVVGFEVDTVELRFERGTAPPGADRATAEGGPEPQG